MVGLKAVSQALGLRLLLDLIVEAFRAFLLTALLFGALICLFESWGGVRLLERLYILLIRRMGALLVLPTVRVLWSVGVTVICTVTEVVAALRPGEEHGLVHVLGHALAFHVVVGMARVVRRGRVSVFVSLRREKCMVNLLKVGLHSVVGSNHRRRWVAHGAIVVIRIATHPMAVVCLSEWAVSHLLSRVVDQHVIGGEERFNLSRLLFWRLLSVHGEVIRHSSADLNI